MWELIQIDRREDIALWDFPALSHTLQCKLWVNKRELFNFKLMIGRPSGNSHHVLIGSKKGFIWLFQKLYYLMKKQRTQILTRKLLWKREKLISTDSLHHIHWMTIMERARCVMGVCPKYSGTCSIWFHWDYVGKFLFLVFLMSSSC